MSMASMPVFMCFLLLSTFHASSAWRVDVGVAAALSHEAGGFGQDTLRSSGAFQNKARSSDATGSDAEQLVEAKTNSTSSSGIIVFMAAARAGRSRGGGGGFGGGAYAGTYRYKPYVPPKPPKWTQLPLGCQYTHNTGLCETALLQKACEAKHPEHLSEVSAEAACNKVWPKKILTFGSGREPFNLYCMAAAADSKLSAKAEELVNLVPEDPNTCKVANMEHLQNRKKRKASERIRFADHSSLLYYTERNMANMSNIIGQVRGFCRRHVVEEPNLAEYGFCRGPTREAQDCDFYWGLREHWDEDYGEQFCKTLAEAGKLRCLAFRKQIIRVAQSRSTFGTAAFSTFDKLFRVKNSNYQGCPKLEDAPDEPDHQEVDEADIVFDDGEAEGDEEGK